jgi:hypothetical protein
MRILFAMVGYVIGTFFISVITGTFLFIVIGYGSALTDVFVRQSDDNYVLFEKRDVGVGALTAGLMLLVFKIFVTIAK